MKSSVRGAGRDGVRLGLIGAILACGAIIAHADEDGRKLLDFKGPIHGPGFRAADMARDAEAAALGESVRNQFPASGAQVLSWIPLTAFPGNNSGNDCWGYVSPSGREYAILGLEKGFGFVEVTDPTDAQVVGYIPGATSMWHDVKVHGHYAYGVSEGGLGIQVIDLSQIDSGVVTLVQNKTQNGHSTTHNIAVNPDTGYLYLVGANIANGGLVAVSTADPANPTIVGSWSTRYVHDAQVVSYTTGPLAGREIAYCFNGSAGIDVVDVTNKSNMFRIGGTSYPGVSYCHQGWLSEDRQYLYMNDELDEGSTVSVTTTRVFSLANPASPSYVSSFTSGKAAIDHNLYVKGNRIYEANYRSGMRIFDNTNPIAPVEIGHIDTYPESDSASFNGAWSIYPFFPSGTILISDIERGLFVVVDNEDPYPALEIELVDAPTQLAPGVSSTIRATIDEIGGEVLDTGAVALRYSVQGGAVQVVAMTQGVDDVWSGQIPAQSCFSGLTYSVRAVAEDGSSYTTPVVNAIVSTGTTVVFEDDMETNKGWTGGITGDTANSGLWVRANPVGTSAQPEDDHTPAPGVICWVTGNASPGAGVGTNDIDGGITTLLSPSFNLSGYSSAVMSYWRWYSNDEGASPNEDTFVIQVSNNGTQWVTAETVGPTGPEASGGWYYHEFNVENFVSLSSNVRIRFRAADLGQGSIVEAAVDDFMIVALTCEEPPACDLDVNGDGTADVLDFLDFLDAYSSCDGQPAGCVGSTGVDPNWNGDAQIDVLDLLDYLDAYSQGC